MHIDKKILSYIRKENAELPPPMDLPKKEQLRAHVDYLCGYAKNKKIIQIGSIDHVMLDPEKMSDYFRVRQMLEGYCSLYLDIELSTEDTLPPLEEKGDNRLAMEKLFRGDSLTHISRHKWDGIILNGILEHLENPLAFLKGIREIYKDNIKEIILTVPNAFALGNFFQSAVRSKQNVLNYYWFSPFTITRMLTVAGYTPILYDFTNESAHLNFLMKYLLTNKPYLRKNIVIVSRF